MFIDEAGSHDDSDVFIISLITCEKPDELRHKIVSLFDDIKHDPNLNVLGNFAQQTSFHYTGDHLNIRNRFIELLIGLEFNSYVVFLAKKDCTEEMDKETLHSKLVKKIIFDRLQENKSREVYMCYENFDSANEKYRVKLEKEINSIREDISQASLIEKQTIHTILADKEEPCLVIADYICGIVRAYIRPQVIKGGKSCSIERNGKTYQEIHYKQINPKIRVIYDYGKDIFYSRKTTKVIEVIW